MDLPVPASGCIKLLIIPTHDPVAPVQLPGLVSGSWPDGAGRAKRRRRGAERAARTESERPLLAGRIGDRPIQKPQTYGLRRRENCHVSIMLDAIKAA